MHWVTKHKAVPPKQAKDSLPPCTALILFVNDGTHPSVEHRKSLLALLAGTDL